MAGLSQAELAKRVGVGVRTVGNWERGSTSPGTSEARLRDVLGLDEVDGDEPEAPPLTVGDMDNLGARLAGVDRQLDALWQRVDELTNQLRKGGDRDDAQQRGPAANQVPAAGPAEQPATTDIISPANALAMRYVSQADGDRRVAMQLLAHDGAEGAGADQEVVDDAFELIRAELEGPPPPTDLIERRGRSKNASVANPFEVADRAAYDPDSDSND